MRTTDKLGFKLIIREPNVDERTVVVCPRYDGLKIKWSRPSGKMYFQKELSGNIKFWGVDFETVQACALRTKFTLVVYDRRMGEIARCDFLKTDCKWDINHATCEVDVSSWNPYKKIEASKDEEYNLVKLNLNKHALNFWRYPLFQTYVRGSSEVANFGFTQGGGRAISCASFDNMDDLRNMYFFNQGYKAGSAFCADSGTYAGRYGSIGDSFETIGGFLTLRASNGNNYEIWLSYFTDGRAPNFWFELRNTSTSPAQQIGRYPLGPSEYITSLDDLLSTHYVYLGGTAFNTRIWIASSRLLTDVALSGTNRGIIDTEIDIAAQSYKYAMNIHQSGIIAVSTRVSDTDKGYGMVENTNVYYNTPDDTNNYIPIWKESWMQGCSLWAKERLITEREKTSYQIEKTVWDFYLLGNAIKAVLHEIDPDLHFEPDTTHSQFLFSTTNPVGGAQQGALYISQKSNVLNLGYDYPAWQAPVTWGKIETLLNNAFNCYWEIYEENGERHLRIEHRTFFENGGTYDGSSTAGLIDLRTIYRTANRTPFSDKTNRWEWDKDGGSTSSCANRYEYGWMDTQSAIFDGETIEVPEDYQLFEDERVEERKVDWFSSDIDFLTSVQAECSSDGFVIVMESLSNAGWIITGNPNYSGQNYELSFEYMQPLYLLSGMYSPMLKIGDSEQPNTFTSRLRKAEVTFSLPDETNVKAGDLIWTEVGKGLAETLELDLSSDHFTATFRYEN